MPCKINLDYRNKVKQCMQESDASIQKCRPLQAQLNQCSAVHVTIDNAFHELHYFSTLSHSKQRRLERKASRMHLREKYVI